MIISEKQIMQLISIVQTYGNNLAFSESMMNQMISQKIALLLGEINNQQSEELKVIE